MVRPFGLYGSGGFAMRLLNILDDRAKQLRNTPSLRNATTRCVRSVSIKDFRNLTETRFTQMRREVLQPRRCESSSRITKRFY